MIAMLFTSVSYGRMARVYPQEAQPSSTSAETAPIFGYITGWCLVMDYVVNPIICTIWCSHAAHEFPARRSPM